MKNKDINIDIVIPVYNEEEILEKNILKLKDFLDREINFKWKIIIANNGSTDRTLNIAKELSKEFSEIHYYDIPQKGRGRALKYAWMQSNADIVGYMDADLSTNIEYFPSLIDGLMSGYDIAIGSRLLKTSRVKRKLLREFISRIYNLMIKLLFFSKFQDAQCGFKALKTEVARQLMPEVKNNNWFFDTELLLLAEHYKYRIFELPIEWVERKESKVNIIGVGLECLYSLLGILGMKLLKRILN